MKIELEKNLGPAPSPVAMISCGNMENSNIATIAWTGILNSEPMIVYVSIRPTRYSHEMITQTKEFTLNLPDEKLVKIADFCGTKSGKDVDKFAACRLIKGQSTKIASPYIAECPLNLECKVLDRKRFPSHDMFVAEVVHTRCQQEILDEKRRGRFCQSESAWLCGDAIFCAGPRNCDARLRHPRGVKIRQTLGNAAADLCCAGKTKTGAAGGENVLVRRGW